MSDVLERVRADNPVRAGAAPPIEEVWVRLERDAGARRRRLRPARTVALAVLALAPVALVVILALNAHGRRGVSGARGSGGVLVEYQTRTVLRPAAGSRVRFAYAIEAADVWVAGAMGHRVETDYAFSRDGRRAAAPTQLELATDGRRYFQYISNSRTGRVAEVAPPLSPSCPAIVGCPSAIAVDPLSEVRQMYRSGALSLVAKGRRMLGHTVIELASTRTRTRVKVFVDERTFVPVEIVAQYGPRPWPAYALSTTTISDYRRLPLTASDRGLLRMRPHPLPSPPPLPGRVIGRINLASPHHTGALGIAYVSRHGRSYLISITAQGVSPNGPKNVYAVWLSGGRRAPHLLGFVSQHVGASRRFSAEGALPNDAAAFRHLLVTLEYRTNPSHPGLVVLSGVFRL